MIWGTLVSCQPPVTLIRSTPAASQALANRAASSLVWLPGTKSLPAMRTPTQKSGPTAARTLAMVSRPKRMRLSREPP